MITLRTAAPQDAEAIASLTREAYTKWIAILGREPRPMQVDYAEALRKHRFDLLHVESDLAALIETRADPDSLMIENVAVRPRYQRQGLGARLLAHADALAMAANLPAVRLYTSQLMVENIRLYEANGFRIESVEENSRGVRVNMIKALKP